MVWLLARCLFWVVEVTLLLWLLLLSNDDIVVDFINLYTSSVLKEIVIHRLPTRLT